MITLYHGSNMTIDSIDLKRCSPNKDFGRGFYLTDIEEQARQMALRRVRIAGEEWALFIMANREARLMSYHHDYDIIVGPVANDGVAFQLARYARQLISMETLVDELTFRKLNRQYFFETEQAISKLQKL